jgi:hypothetical protein
MKAIYFEGISPYEIGDNLLIKGKVHTLTDIAFTTYASSEKTLFTYELDNSGVYKTLKELVGWSYEHI